MAIRPSESRCAISSTVMRAIEEVIDVSPRLGAAAGSPSPSGLWPDQGRGGEYMREAACPPLLSAHSGATYNSPETDFWTEIF